MTALTVCWRQELSNSLCRLILQTKITILPTGIFWLKASVVDFADGVAKSVSVHPQAVLAEYTPEGNDPSRLLTPLPAGTISSLLVRQAAIGKVEQPFESFGGVINEQDETFYTRISERLKHKNRAVTLVDYEQLVLQQFPEVYKAKCLNHSGIIDPLRQACIDPDHTPPPAPDCYPEHRPGQVTVVVIPSLQNENAVDPLRPRLSANKRNLVQEFLCGHVSDFVTVDVVSPHYQEVRINTTVAFAPGRDVAFYRQVLREDLVRFIAPWGDNPEADLNFGRSITRADLLNYIDERPYVDFITALEVYVRFNDKCSWQSVDEAIPATSRSVLTSVPADQHVVTPHTEEICLNLK